MKKSLIMAGVCALSVAALAGCSTTPAENTSNRAEMSHAELDCSMDFALTGWSLIYKHADGNGVVRCENGKSMPVTITVTGGGLTAGKWHVDDGSGTFSDVHEISDVLGSYAAGSAHAGVVGSGSVQALTKGDVSLVLAGTGEGVDLGVDVSKFTIKRR